MNYYEIEITFYNDEKETVIAAADNYTEAIKNIPYYDYGENAIKTVTANMITSCYKIVEMTNNER